MTIILGLNMTDIRRTGSLIDITNGLSKMFVSIEFFEGI